MDLRKFQSRLKGSTHHPTSNRNRSRSTETPVAAIGLPDRPQQLLYTAQSNKTMHTIATAPLRPLSPGNTPLIPDQTK